MGEDSGNPVYQDYITLESVHEGEKKGNNFQANPKATYSK